MAFEDLLGWECVDVDLYERQLPDGRFCSCKYDRDTGDYYARVYWCTDADVGPVELASMQCYNHKAIDAFVSAIQRGG